MKYRVWDKRHHKYFKQGEWETFIWVDHDGKPFEMNITIHGCWLSPEDVSDKYEVEYCCEDKDKNGTWIYIHDIVCIQGTVCPRNEKIDEFSSIPWVPELCEVVGNKNENRELWESL